MPRVSFDNTLLVPQVRIAKQMTLGRTVDPKDIAVLTPYNAQAAEISKSLLREGVAGVTVCSISKSQGEGGSGAGGTWASGSRGRMQAAWSAAADRGLSMPAQLRRKRVALRAGEHGPHVPGK